METRHREEEENLAHCLVSSGGGWTQGFLPAAPDRGAPPPVNSPVESSQYTHSACAFTCNVTHHLVLYLLALLHFQSAAVLSTPTVSSMYIYRTRGVCMLSCKALKWPFCACF